ncbi:hypothetical protein BH24CHL1_BH24CHL1_06350 [soil metagenome]
MSGMPPVQPRSREMEIVRVLFDRHLLDRAVNLAEARWPGSGEMVRLAYTWTDLEPGERRQRLEELGPEKILEYRAFADLHPDLAQVIDNLEARGGLLASPDVVELERDIEAAMPESTAHVVRSKLMEPELEEDDLGPSGAGLAEPSVDDSPTPEIELSNLASIDARLDDFKSTAQDRRAESLATGAETLERVRARLNASARRVASGPIGSGPSSVQLSTRLPAAVTATPGAAQSTIVIDEGRFTPPPGYWLEQLSDNQVVVAGGRILPPSDDELVALANELGLGLAEFVVEPGATRALFGGLERNGGVVEVAVGALPTALAAPNLVVVRGRLFAKVLERLRAGMCDIPGTRATVRLDPSSRVLIVPA